MKKIIWSLLLILAFSVLLYADMGIWASVTIDNVKYSATSLLKEKGKPDNYYGPDKAFDEDPGTAWCEGKKGDGIGESITITTDPVKIYGINVLNGYGKYRYLYEQNNRVKDFRVTFYSSSGKEKVVTGTFGKDLCGIYLDDHPTVETFCDELMHWSKRYPSYAECIKEKRKECILEANERNTGDHPGGQKILLKTPMTVKKVKLEILSVYKGKKFRDTCIGTIILLDFNESEFGPYEKNNQYKKY